MPNTEKGTKASRCIWSDADDAVLVGVLKKQKELGNTSGAGWKQQVWHAVEKALRKSDTSKGALKTAAKCSDHWSNVSPIQFRVLSIEAQSKLALI